MSVVSVEDPTPTQSVPTLVRTTPLKPLIPDPYPQQASGQPRNKGPTPIQIQLLGSSYMVMFGNNT